MGEGVGRQVPARSLGARSRTEPSNSLTTRADVPHPGLPRELPGTGCISARGPGPHCRWTALTQEGASSCQPTGDSAALPPSLGEWLMGQWSSDPGTQGQESTREVSPRQMGPWHLRVSYPWPDTRSEEAQVFFLSPLSDSTWSIYELP